MDKIVLPVVYRSLNGLLKVNWDLNGLAKVYKHVELALESFKVTRIVWLYFGGPKKLSD